MHHKLNQSKNPFKVNDAVCGKDFNMNGHITKIISDRLVTVYDTETEMEGDYNVSQIVHNIWKGGDFDVPAKESKIIKAKKPKSKTIDLHFERLPANFKRTGNIHPIEAQMSYFRYTLENAIAEGTKMLTFIHGKGKGALKEKIMAVIKNDIRVQRTEHEKHVLESLSHSVTIYLK